ncbi:MAG: hypothetical protein JXR75_07165 [Rhodobacteraceae bacterium]|nr:hypothetical protein [Paracoccaceae bacterium]
MATVLAGLVLAGCQPEVLPEVLPGPDLATCGADGLQGLVGQPAAVLQGMTFGQSTRILRPGMAVTMDYRPDRLNIDIDAAERIVRVHCT